MKRLEVFGRRGWPLLAILSLTVSAELHAQEAEPPEDAYAAGDYGRLRHQENGATLVREETGAAREFPTSGDVNAPIFPGDTLVTGPDQRAEVQLASGSVVRIDEGSEVTFLALPQPYGEIADDTVIQLAEGTLRLAALVAETEGFRVDTPAATAWVLGDSDVRIEVRGGATYVQSRRGLVEVVAGGDSVLLRGGMSTEISDGSTPRDPEPFNTFLADRFDRWVEEREATYAVTNGNAEGDVYHELPVEVRPYYSELSVHGSWVHTPDYGYVWCPRAVPAHWRPYADGYWAYGPHGYFWISTEPWGWAPYHYGRWSWVGGYGWAWVPGRVFGGAWVSWSWGPSHVGWCALNYWNRPFFHTTVVHGYYDPLAWTFVSYKHLHRHHVHHHEVGVHLSVTDVPDVRESVIVTRAPHVEPSLLASSVDARGAALSEVRARRMASLAPDVEVHRAVRPAFVDTERPLRERTVASASRSAAAGGEARTVQAATRRLSSERRVPSAAIRRPTAAPIERAPEGQEGNVDDRRMRDVYRRVAQPRPTRAPEQRAAETSPTVESARPAAEPPAESPTRVAPREVTPATRDETTPERSSQGSRGSTGAERSGGSKAPERSQGSKSSERSQGTSEGRDDGSRQERRVQPEPGRVRPPSSREPAASRVRSPVTDRQATIRPGATVRSSSIGSRAPRPVTAPSRSAGSVTSSSRTRVAASRSYATVRSSTPSPRVVHDTRARATVRSSPAPARAPGSATAPARTGTPRTGSSSPGRVAPAPSRTPSRSGAAPKAAPRSGSRSR
jgi:hypothetical protein